MTKSLPIRADARKLSRATLLLNAHVARAGEDRRAVMVRNLSAGGLMFEGFPELAVDDAVVAELPGIGEVAGVIAWTEAGRAGMAFASAVDASLAQVESAPTPKKRAKSVRGRPRLNLV